MLLSLLLSLAVSARAEENTLLSYQVFRAGVPPTWSSAQAEAGLKRVRDLELKLNQIWTANSDPNLCGRYQDDLFLTNAQIGVALNEALSTTDPTVKQLNQTRLQILFGALGHLYTFFSQGVESGYDTLTHAPFQSCLSDRTQVRAVFDQFLEAARDVQIGALGRPGFDSLNVAEDEMLRLADRADIYRGRMRLTVNVLALGASLVFWEVFPPVALMGARAAFGVVPLRLTQPIVMNGLRGLGFYADAGAFVYSEKYLAAEAVKAHANVAGAYDENLSAIEAFLKSPLESPELYFGYLNMIKAQLVQDRGPWLNEHHAEFNLGPAWLSLVNESTEALNSPGQPLHLKIAEIRDQLNLKYNFLATCEDSRRHGLTDPDCLLGLRHTLTAFQRALTPALTKLSGQVLNLKIGNASDVHLNADDVTLEIPSSMPAEEIGRLIQTQLGSDEVTLRLDVRRAALRASLRLGQLWKGLVEYRDEVTQVERWRAADRLADLFSYKPELLNRRAEVLLVGRQNRAAFERKLLITEEVDASAPAERWIEFLSRPMSEAFAQKTLQRRNSIQATAVRLQNQYGLNVQCRREGGLELKDCDLTLRRLQADLDSLDQVQVRGGPVVVVGLGDLNQPLRDTDDGVFAVRTDYRLAQLIGYGSRRGWLRLPRSE